MNDVISVKTPILRDLENAGKISPYKADANEPDPRYKSYGVRAPQKRAIFKHHRQAIHQLEMSQQVALAYSLIKSGLGEQQSIGLWILEPHSDYFSPTRFSELDQLVRCLFGWSKVDQFTGSLLREVLFNHPEPFLELVKSWNHDPDQWLRRASVVLFTRKVAESGQFTGFAIHNCDNLKYAPEDLVRKGIGWSLKDLMRADKQRVLDFVFQLRQQNVSSVITSYASRDLKGQERVRFLARR
jgi:3-methyladenine DNA glycosylase AlkD